MVFTGHCFKVGGVHVNLDGEQIYLLDIMNWIILWLVVVILEASRHLFLIRVRKVSPNKTISLWARFGAAIVIGLLDVIEGIRPIEVIVLAYLFSGWFIHDVMLAVGTGKKPWYLNGTGPIDRAQSSIGQTSAFVLKGIAAITLVTMYFVNYA